MTVYPVPAGRDWFRLDRDGGLAYGSSDPQGDAIQAAIDTAATYGLPILHSGPLTSDIPLEFRGSARWTGTGDGDNASNSPAVLEFTELGDEWCITCANDGVPYDVGDFTLQGPISGAISQGAQPTLTNGLLAETGGRWRNIRIRGVNSTLGQRNDHQKFININGSGNNVVGLDYVDNYGGGFGDVMFWECNFTACSQASIAVHPRATMSGAQWHGGHLGASPFGLWRRPQYDTVASSSGNVLTGVNVTFTPTIGMTIVGYNIPAGTTISGVAGSSGAWVLTLSASTTGLVTRCIVSPYGTFVRGMLNLMTSWERCERAAIYDQVRAIYGSSVVGGITDIKYDPPQEADTFVSAYEGDPDGKWEQGPISAAGSTGNPTLNGVALTQFKPMEGLAVTGSNVPDGARVLDWSGSAGNYSLLLDRNPTGGVSSVTVGQPADLASIDGSQVDRLDWRGESPAFSDSARQLIAADTITNIRVHHGGPKQAKPFRLKGAWNSNDVPIYNVKYGDGQEFGYAAEALAPGDVLETVAYGQVQKYRSTVGSQYAGIVGNRSYAQGDAVEIQRQPGGAARVHSHASYGTTLTSDHLVKPDPAHDGCVIKADSPTDGLVLGKIIGNGFAGGGSGQLRLT